MLPRSLQHHPPIQLFWACFGLPKQRFDVEPTKKTTARLILSQNGNDIFAKNY
jgi:hypothetical protein